MNKRIKEFISIMETRNTTLLEMLKNRKSLSQKDIDLFSHIGVSFKYQNEEDAELLSVEKDGNSVDSIPPLKFYLNSEKSYKINILTSKEESYNRYTILNNGGTLSEILVIRRLDNDFEIGIVKTKITNLPEENMQRLDKDEKFYKYSERKNKGTSPEEFFKEIIMSYFFYDIRYEEVDFILELGF